MKPYKYDRNEAPFTVTTVATYEALVTQMERDLGGHADLHDMVVQTIEAKTRGMRARTEEMGRLLAARQGVDPHVAKAATEVLAEMQLAEQATHKALQFGRTFTHEPRLAWIVDQLETMHRESAEFVKTLHESLEYTLRATL